MFKSQPDTETGEHAKETHEPVDSPFPRILRGFKLLWKIL